MSINKTATASTHKCYISHGLSIIKIGEIVGPLVTWSNLILIINQTLSGYMKLVRYLGLLDTTSEHLSTQFKTEAVICLLESVFPKAMYFYIY